MDLKLAAKRELDRILEKINSNMKLYHDKTPCISTALKYSENLSEDGDWTGSFWTGMVTMAALLTGDKKYQEYLESYRYFYEKRIATGYKDHDLGFLYQLYAVDMYRLTNIDCYREMAVKAARSLMCRYNPRGGFIRAWGTLISSNNKGKIIMDCLMNLPLLFCASRMGGDSQWAEAAHKHALITLNNIRPDGSTYHTYDFDNITGVPLKGENEGGWQDESCWSRGQSWGIYGFYLAWIHTGDPRLLKASQKVADYFINNLDDSYIPEWDFKLIEDAPRGIDTSAAMIAASGLYDLAKVSLAEDSKRYTQAADRMLQAVMENHSRTSDPNSEALIDCCYGGRIIDGKRVVLQMGAIWGDYYYMEALMKKAGYDISMWDL